VAADALPTFLTTPLTNLEGGQRCTDAGVLAALLRPGSRSVGDLAAELQRAGVGPASARATVAWLLKYGLLEPSSGDSP
jgi:hypothetical protein